MSNFAEQQTEWIISNNLINRGWVIDNGNGKNVFFQKPPIEEHRKKLKGKKPDYILYQSDTTRPIAIIEAKKGGVGLKDALEQGIEYAQLLEAPLVFAMNGAYCETRFVPNGKELILNKSEVRELIREVEALEFINKGTNEVCTIPEKVLISREELIKIFKNLNNTLRGEGLRAGIERFSEFANILFLKLLSESNSKKESWWSLIKKQNYEHAIGFINDFVINRISEKYNGDVFTPLLIKNPKTLFGIIERLDPLVLSTIDSDVKGDAFEYFLEQTTSTENDLGEYFTPRHIVKSIINLVDPKFKETIYDPFCGTGGFLTSAFHYIKENNIIDREDVKRLQSHTLFGNEITTTARIAKMNMILQGDGHSGIQQMDTLANPVDGKYDAIITNMPFAQKTEEGWRYYNGIAKNSGDAVCVLHCLRALKQGGRMALVVPEGFLFRKNIAEVRKFLLSKCKLQSLVSLPQGTFLPYTGVKTDILYFTNAHEPNNQKEYWYFDVKNIGYTLDNHRRKIKGKNDLNKLAEIDLKKIEKDQDLKHDLLQIGFDIVDLEKVKNNDYNLIGGVYRAVDITSKYQILQLEAVCSEIKNGITIKQDKFEGKYRVSRIESISDGVFNIDKTQYTNDLPSDNDFLEPSDILFSHINSFDHLAKTAIYVGDNKSVIHGSNLIKLKPNKHIINPTYLSYILKSDEFVNIAKKLGQRAVNQASIRVSALRKLLIPVPSLLEQQEIVNELDSYQKIIDGARQMVDNWKPWLNITNNEYDQVYLKDLLQNIQNKFIKIKKQDCNTSGKYPVISQDRRSNIGYTDLESGFIKKQDLPLILFGDHTLEVKYIENEFFVGADGVKLLKFNKDILSKYAYYFMKSLVFIKQTQQQIIGKCYRRHWSIVKNIKIPLPPLRIQQEIVEQLEQERKMIDSQKEIIKLFEAKIQNKLNSIWQFEEENKINK